MKKQAIVAVLTALTLAGCGAGEEPSSDATTPTAAETTTAPTPTATKPTPAKTTASKTPTQTAEPLPEKTEFSAQLATGEPVTFRILTEDQQEALNSQVKGTGMTGSWGVLCSTEMTSNQLSGYAVITTASQGRGPKYKWQPVDASAAQNSHKWSQELSETVAATVNASNADLGQCQALQTPSPSAGELAYPSARVGMNLGESKMMDEVEMK